MRKTQQVMPTRCNGVSLLEAPRARWSSCLGLRLTARSPSAPWASAPWASAPWEWKGLSAEAREQGASAGPAHPRPSEGELSRSPDRRTPNPEAARGTATRCTRARAVGGRTARAPCKRRTHAGVSGRCQPSGWWGSRGARRAPGGGKARSIAALSLVQVRGAFARAIHPPPATAALVQVRANVRIRMRA